MRYRVNFKHGFGYLAYAVVVGLLVHFGVNYLSQLNRGSFYAYELSYLKITLTSIFPVVIGIFLALPQLIQEVKKSGSWQYDLTKSIYVGFPTFFLAISPIILFSPLLKPQYSVRLYEILLGQSSVLHIVSGIVLGYVLLTAASKIED